MGSRATRSLAALETDRTDDGSQARVGVYLQSPKVLSNAPSIVVTLPKRYGGVLVQVDLERWQRLLDDMAHAAAT